MPPYVQGIPSNTTIFYTIKPCELADKFLYLVLEFIGKMRKSKKIGVNLSLEIDGKPTTVLAALLVIIWRPLITTIFGGP